MKYILGYNKRYKITKNGRVWTSLRNRFLKEQKHRLGYRVVFLTDKFGKAKSKYIHRLVAEAFIPNSKNKPEINHKNGIKNDNRVKNIEWTTHLENMRHAHKNGLIIVAKGSKHGMSKLNEKKVKQIKGMLNDFSLTEIAKKFNVSITNIYDIKRNYIWKYV